MQFHRVNLPKRLLAVTFLFGVCLMLGADEPTAGPKPSAYAPAKDLIAQVDYFMERLGKSLASEAEYDEAKQSRVTKDASTLAAIGLVLGMHDEDHKLKQSSPALVNAAQELVEGAADYNQAATAYAKLKVAAAGKVEGDPGKLEWKQVTSLPALMKQVPLINNPLRRAVSGTRFKREAEQAAGQAATLAAIGQASIYDLSAVTEPAQEPQWREFSAQLRDTAGALNTAINQGDQSQAKVELKRLTQSCDDCHAVFREGLE